MSEQKVEMQQEAELSALANEGGAAVGSSVGAGDFDPRGELEALKREAEGMPTSELLTAVFTGAGAIAAERYGEHWAMTEKESAIMGAAVGDVVDKYLPDIKAGPEVALVLASATVFLPKYARHKILASEKAEGGSGGDQSQP